MTRSLLLLIAALGLTALTGCGAHPGIERGHALVASGDYRQALVAYQDALEADPDDEEAARLVARIRPWARDQAFDEAEAALGAGRYEEAVAHAGYVERLDPALGAELRDQVQATMRASLEAALVEGRHATAYPLAIRAHRLFPHMRGLGTVFERLRAHYRQQSRQLADRGDFEGALAALEVIEKHEPALSGSLAPERAAIRRRWADTLVARGAAEEEAGRIGIAAATYARAYEIAERERDGDRMRRLLRELRPLGELTLALDIEGDPERRERVAALLEPQLAALEGMVLTEEGDDGGVTMRASAHLAPLQCSQSSRRQTREQEYVSGYRDVENPQWARLTRAIEATHDDLDRHDRDAADALAKRERAADAVTRCLQREEEPAERALAKAERARERAEARAEEQRQELRRLERQRDADSAALERARDELRRRERQADDARREADDARRALDRAHRSCDRHRDDVAEHDEKVLEAQTEMREASRELARLERDRARTPATISEPVIDIYRYPVELHRRSCGGDIALAVERSWAGPERHELRAERETQDVSHGAHPTIDLASDPLAFPEPDDALRAGADEDGSRQIAARITRDVRQYYRRSVERAYELADDDPDGATRLLLAIAAVARNHLDPSHDQQLSAFLEQRYGLTSPAILAE